MALHLPEKGAPPSNYDWMAPTTLITPASHQGGTAGHARRKTATLGNGEVHGSTSRPFITGSNGHGRAQPRRVSNSTAALEPADIDDTRKLEDMLQHSESLLSNDNLCALLPGGKGRVATRHEAIRSRLEHLYHVHGINRQMRDATLGEAKPGPSIPTTSAVPIKRELGDMPHVKKEEDMDGDLYALALTSGKEESQQYSSSPGSGGLGQSPPSSPANGFHRNWSKAIPAKAYMNGRMAQLSLDESLALQAKESERTMAARQAAERRAELQRVREADANRGGRSNAVREMLYATLPEYEGPEDEQDDYDWHQQGYYDDDGS